MATEKFIQQPPKKIRKLHQDRAVPPTTTCQEFSDISEVELPPDGVGVQFFFNTPEGEQLTLGGPRGTELQTTIGGRIGSKAYKGTLLAKIQQELKEETAGVLEIHQSDTSATGYVLQVKIKNAQGQEFVNSYPLTFRADLTHSAAKIETTEKGELKGFHYATFTVTCDGLSKTQLSDIASYMSPTMQFCNTVFLKLNAFIGNGYLKKFNKLPAEEAQTLWNSPEEIGARAALAKEFSTEYYALQEKGQMLLQPQQLLQYTQDGKTTSYGNFEQGLKELFVEAPSQDVLKDGFFKQISNCSERPFYDVFVAAELADAAKRSEEQKAAADAQAKIDNKNPRAEASPAAAIVAISSATGNDYKFGFMSAPAYCAAYEVVLPKVSAEAEGKKRKGDESSSIKALIQHRSPSLKGTTPSETSTAKQGFTL